MRPQYTIIRLSRNTTRLVHTAIRLEKIAAPIHVIKWAYLTSNIFDILIENFRDLI